MPQRDVSDFVAAFTLGAVLGVTAVLLLRPDPPGRGERILRDLKPYRKKLRRDVSLARKRFSEGADASAEVGGDIVAAGRELLRELRQELAEILSSAREDFTRGVDEQLAEAQRSIKRRTTRRR